MFASPVILPPNSVRLYGQYGQDRFGSKMVECGGYVFLYRFQNSMGYGRGLIVWTFSVVWAFCVFKSWPTNVFKS